MSCFKVRLKANSFAFGASNSPTHHRKKADIGQAHSLKNLNQFHFQIPLVRIIAVENFWKIAGSSRANYPGVV